LGGFSVDVGNSTFSFVQLGAETPISESFAVEAQLVTSFLTFKSEEQGKTIKAEAPGVAPLIGLKYQLTDASTISVLGGYQIKETHSFGERPAFRNDNGAVLKLEFYSQLTATTELLMLYRYAFAEQSHFGLMSLTREVLRFGSREQFALGLGFEAATSISTDFSQEQAAPLLHLSHRPTNASLQLRIGVSHFASGGRDHMVPHIGLTFRASF